MFWVEDGELRLWLEENLARSHRVLIASPSMTRDSLRPLLLEVSKPRRALSVTLLTNLDVRAGVTGELDTDVLKELLSWSAPRRLIQVYHVPGLRSSVWLFDERTAVIGCTNLTSVSVPGSGTELGAGVTNRKELKALAQRAGRWYTGRAPLDSTALDRHKQIVEGYYHPLRSEFRAINPGRIQAFPGKDQSYFHNLLSALSLAARKKGRPRELVLERLKLPKQSRDSAGGPEERLLFLQYLGLVEQQHEYLHLTETGRAIRQDQDPAAFFEVLRKHIPVVQQIHRLLLETSPADISYAQLCSLPGFIQDEIDSSLLWLCSLDILEKTGYSPDGSDTFTLVKQ